MDLKERIKRHEGLRLTPYEDENGNMTIGYGHNLKFPIPVAAAEVILDHDIRKATMDLLKLPKAVLTSVNQPRAEVLIEMIFNMGLYKVLRFRRMLDAITTGDFDRAAEEMLNSRWARQTGKRARLLAEIMRKGRL